MSIISPYYTESFVTNIRIRRSIRSTEVSQSCAQGDPQYSARTLFALSHSEYPFHCRRERSFDRKHPRVSQGVREASSVIAGVVENTAPQAGNIVWNGVINVPGSLEYLNGNLMKSLKSSALFFNLLLRCNIRYNLPRNCTNFHRDLVFF